MKSTTLRRSIVLLAALALAQSTAGYQPIEPGAAEVPATLATAEGDPVGAGWFSRAVCIGCIGGALFGGGASIAGLVLLVVARPAIAGFCIGACAA